jgi:hypothetical protein
MTPRLGGKAPAPGSGWLAEGPGIGAGPGDPAGGGGPPVSRWPIPSAAGSERSGSRVRASGVGGGAGAHLRNDKLPAIGSGDVQNPPKPVTVLPWGFRNGSERRLAGESWS